MNEDFISSSMETGIRLPMGDEGGPGGDPAFPSTLSMGGRQPIKSPTASHGCEELRCALARPATGRHFSPHLLSPRLQSGPLDLAALLWGYLSLTHTHVQK